MNKALFALPIAGAFVLVAMADPPPPAPVIFEAAGAVCVSYDGDLECFCPCAGTCVAATQLAGDPTPTIRTPQEPTDTPEVTVTATPVPTERPACNRGIGNGSEQCDPGNSGGQGQGGGRGAGEDRGEGGGG